MKNNITFKPFGFTDIEYQAYTDIWNAYYPDDLYAPEEIRHDDESRDQNYLFQRFTVFEDEQIIGFCMYRQSPSESETGRMHVAIHLSPDCLGDDYQSALYEFLMQEIALFKPNQLAALAREDKTIRMAFYQKQGFEVAMRYPRSILDIQKFNESKFTALIEKLEAQGIELISVAEISKRDPDWIQKWREIEWEILQDVPSTTPPDKHSLEHYQKLVDFPGFYPPGCFFALAEGEMIGLSFLWRTEIDDHFIYTGLTGIKRDYRRRGIATALKTKSIEVAKADGFEFVETANEENNPMYQLNLQLGYEPAPAWLEYKKEISTT